MESNKTPEEYPEMTDAQEDAILLEMLAERGGGGGTVTLEEALKELGITPEEFMEL